MGEMKAIETIYAGHRFRSRLEARWAVVFDTLGIRWEYEPEGFETSAGRYLPDFRFDGLSVRHCPDSAAYDGPPPRVWAEVKGAPLSDVEARKVMAFAFDSGEPRWVVALGAIPDWGCLPLFTGWGKIDGIPRAMSWALVALTRDLDLSEWRACGDWYGEPQRDELPKFSGHFRRKPPIPDYRDYPQVEAAFDAGRMARFEHGESGR
jgi:hypothetical protein